MIKVIGKSPDIAKTVTCRDCSSILEYLPIDVMTYTKTDYGGGIDVYKTVSCPTCGKDVHV